MTGPNTSWLHTFMSALVSTRIVGWMTDPSRVPPVNTRAPPSTASCIQASIRSAEAVSITGPTSTAGSMGSPTLRLSTCLTSRVRKSS